MIAPLAGGGALLLIAIVVGLGFALGWFSGGGASSDVRPGPKPGPVVDGKKEPSKEAQAVFNQISLHKGRMTAAVLQKEIAGSRDASAAELKQRSNKSGVVMTRLLHLSTAFLTEVLGLNRV